MQNVPNGQEPSRQLGLANQYELLSARRQRLECLLKTLEESIFLTKKGESMNSKAMFQGLNQAEWENALSEQNDYLKGKYDYDMLANKEIQAEDLNEKATESQQFLQSLSAALKNGWAVTDEKLHDLIEKHLNFLNSHGLTIDAKSFVSQTRFFLEDDFHRNMLETQQPGLCYYLCFAAETYASLK